MDISKPPSSGSHFISSGLTVLAIASDAGCANVQAGHDIAVNISVASKLFFTTTSLPFLTSKARRLRREARARAPAPASSLRRLVEVDNSHDRDGLAVVLAALSGGGLAARPDITFLGDKFLAA